MRSVLRSAVCVAALALAACGGGGGGTAPAPQPPPPAPGPTAAGVYTLPAPVALTSAEVQQIIAQAVAEARARNLPSVIAVTDRVGNVLAVYSMAGARATTRLRDGPSGTNLDAQGVVVPAAAAAIAKAITGAYLSSSGGNAFSTRTASQIVQEHFPPAPSAVGLESGPLFGVQFSSLPCSDVVNRGATLGIGPRRSPLGLSADPGGFPIYKNGTLVGGVGVVGDGDYGFDRNILDVDADDEENIAYAATVGFDAPVDQRADRITVDGTALRYSDASTGTLRTTPSSAPAFSTLGAAGSFTAVTGYYAGGAALAGQAYGSEASGLRLATSAEFSIAGAMVLSDGTGSNRFPIRGGTDAADGLTPLSAAESRALLEEAFTIMSRARGQIRRPLDSRAEVTITLVDSRGQILGIVRSPDAPVFGIDVSAQKARSTNLFSGTFAASTLSADPSADVRSFVQRTRDFFGNANALTGQNAITPRAIGNLHRPYFPDGEVGRPPGPLSRPISQWSPLSTGLQSALIIGNIGQHLGFVLGANADTPARCTSLPEVAPGQNRLQNGLQIFPGGVPIYRGNRLVGAIGVSGDGIDQDDMIAFLGTHNGGLKVGGSVGNAPVAIRSDTLFVGPTNTRLRYVGCPFAPFLDTNDQNACQGK